MTNPFEQMPFEGSEFVDNPEPRCPCLLLLDVSGSMQGRPIDELNNGLATLKSELLTDSLAAKRVEIAVVTFGPVETKNDFTSTHQWQVPVLTPQGNTPIGEAIEKGLALLEARKALYRTNGIAYFRPWVMLITDGVPTDSCSNAAALVRNGEAEKTFSFYAIGVEGAQLDVLAKIAVREPLALRDLRFRDLFLWLSSSLGAVAASRPGENVQLANPATPKGWGSTS